MKGTLKCMVDSGIVKSPSRPGIAITAYVLNILDPKTLPTAIPWLPFLAALRLTTTSGSDVPKATTVIAITCAGISAIEAKFSSDSIVYLALKYINNAPIAMVIQSLGLVFVLTIFSSPWLPLKELVRKTPSAIKKMIHSKTLNVRSCKAKYRRNAEPNNIGISDFMTSCSILIPLPKMAAAPNTNKMLVIFDPTALPITTSDVPLYTETIEVASSGNDVPNATIVTPITNDGIPKASPIFSEESTNLSDAISNTIMLTRKMRIDINNVKLI